MPPTNRIVLSPADYGRLQQWIEQNLARIETMSYSVISKKASFELNLDVTFAHVREAWRALDLPHRKAQGGVTKADLMLDIRRLSSRLAALIEDQEHLTARVRCLENRPIRRAGLFSRLLGALQPGNSLRSPS